MPMMKLPVRSVIVTVGANKILISPGSKLSPEDYSRVSGVTDIVAPNHFHSAGVSMAAEWFPKARLWAAPGLKAKKSEIPWTDELSETAWPYQKELPMFHLKGTPNVEEVVFVHPASRSIIVCDLVFNMIGISGFGNWVIGKMFGTYNRFAMSKFFARFIKDKVAFEAASQKVFNTDFDQIILSHGDIIESDGKARLKAAFQSRGYF